MNLKTSFFNKFFSKAVVKSDIKRHWWASAILMVMYLLFLFPSISYYEYASSADLTFSSFLLWHTDSGALSYCASFILAGLLFSYLHRSSSVSFMHGIPVTRTQQYFSHIISGFIILLIPILLITSFIASKSSFAPEYFCLTATVSLLFFSVVTMVSTLVGNRFAAMIFSAGLMLFPAYIEMLKEEFLKKALRGYVWTPGIFKYLYINAEEVPENFNFLIYVGLSVVCLLIGFIMYKYRDLENSSEIVAFNWLRPVFMVIVTFCFSTFAYVISDRNIIISFIAGIVTLGVSYMLVQKIITLRGSSKHFIAYTVIFLFAIAAIVFDLFGYVKNIPDINNVKSASFFNKLYYDDSLMIGEDYYKAKSQLNDDEKQLLIDFHKDIANMSNAEYLRSGYFNISFEYDLILGGKLKRNYDFSYSMMKNHSKLFNTWAYVQYTYPFLNPHNETVLISISNRTLSSEETTAFTEAFVKDLQNHIENNTFIDIMDPDKNKETLTEFVINYTINSKVLEDYYYLRITNDYPETIKYIDEYLVNESTDTNITNITVSNDSNIVFTFDKNSYPEIIDSLSQDIISLDPIYGELGSFGSNDTILEEAQKYSKYKATSTYKISVTLGDPSNTKTANTDKHYEFYIPEDYKNTISYVEKNMEKS